METHALMVLNGLSWGMTVFLAAAGLTLVFGILGILNFAHGGFVMLGAYLALSIQTRLGEGSLLVYAVTMLLCTAALAGVGIAVDKVVFSRLRGVSESYSLIATYALLLLCQGVVKLVWGIDVLSVPAPIELKGMTDIGGVFAPDFVLFVLASGLVVFLALDHVVHRTQLGKMMQSVAADPWMSSLLGVNVRAILLGTVVTGVALAGLAGAILAANQGLSPDMGSTLIIQAFGVIIVGGMGNVRGAFVAAILLGLVVALGDRYFNWVPGLFFYLALIAILMLRPQGLMKGSHA